MTEEPAGTPEHFEGGEAERQRVIAETLRTMRAELKTNPKARTARVALNGERASDILLIGEAQVVPSVDITYPETLVMCNKSPDEGVLAMVSFYSNPEGGSAVEDDAYTFYLEGERATVKFVHRVHETKPAEGKPSVVASGHKELSLEECRDLRTQIMEAFKAQDDNA